MKKVSITQFKNGSFNIIDDNVAEEKILHLEINSEINFDVIITPEDIEPFVYGNLYSEGFIKSPKDVLGYSEKIRNGLISVVVKIKDFSKRSQFFRKNYNIVWTECGSTGEVKRMTDQFKAIESGLKIKADVLLTLRTIINDKIELFKQTGAFHYAFLFDENLGLRTYAYDIGRHNAIDKAIGKELLKTGKLDDKIIYTTGRISSDIIMKCLRAKIPIIISRGAPLHSAVELARKYNMCLIGFLRGKRFNIYSSPEKIIR